MSPTKRAAVTRAAVRVVAFGKMLFVILVRHVILQVLMLDRLGVCIPIIDRYDYALSLGWFPFMERFFCYLAF